LLPLPLRLALLLATLGRRPRLVRGRARLRLELGAPESIGDLRGAHEERALEGGVSCALRLDEELLREVLPFRPLRLAPLDRLRRALVSRAEREELPVRSERRGVVEELLVPDARELRHELCLPRAGRERRLDLEEV